MNLLDKIARLNVLVIGDIMLDHYIWGDATRISPEAPVPVVSVFRDTHTAGGAANVALNLRGLGASASLCGLTGDDDAGARLRALLVGAGVQMEPCWQGDMDLATILKTRVIVQKQQLCRIDREDSPESYAAQTASRMDALMASVDEADAVVLSDYAKGMIHDTVWQAVQERAGQRGILVALDPKPRRRLAFTGPDLMTPNRAEALELADIEAGPHDPFPAEAVCRAIWERHRPKHLVVTLGAEGMLLSAGGRVLKTIPTVAREVFDVSGAGDTVIATLTAALAAGANLEEAAHLANTAAGVVVGHFGTVPIRLEELQAALADAS